MHFFLIRLYKFLSMVILKKFKIVKKFLIIYAYWIFLLINYTHLHYYLLLSLFYCVTSIYFSFIFNW